MVVLFILRSRPPNVDIYYTFLSSEMKRHHMRRLSLTFAFDVLGLLALA
jgi:hypothetical protein